MTSTNPTDVVREFMAAMAAADYERALSLVAPDIRYTNMPLGLEAGTVIGPEGILAVLGPFFAPTISNEWDIKCTAAEGNTVFMERLDRHQLAGGWAELPVVGVFEVNDGRITAWRDYFDWNTIVKSYIGAGGPDLGNLGLG